MNDYIGNDGQISGVTEVVLAKGKGKGMTLLQVRNGLGLEIELCPDRCLDITRVIFKGDNIGYFAPCGYVAPQYYDGNGSGFLKSFTAGFMTTCGLNAVGSPCVDQGESLPLHGSIANTPCQNYYYTENETEITVTGEIVDAFLFGSGYLLKRVYRISKTDNLFSFTDEAVNKSDRTLPCMLLYHINFGYPMLCEDSVIDIPAKGVFPRTDNAAEFIDSACIPEKPQAGYVERCYYHDVIAENGYAKIGISNPKIGKGVEISYLRDALPCFTEWKMMGKREYVLGLEPGNCTPDGRDVMRKNGTLVEIMPGESYKTEVKLRFYERSR